jgi:hypothetical protein
MQQTAIRILKSTSTESPLSYNDWCKKFNVGSRVPRINKDLYLYENKDYDFSKLSMLIKKEKPSLYDRILKSITSQRSRR